MSAHPFLGPDLGCGMNRPGLSRVGCPSEVYSRLALPDAQHRYDQEISKFPV